METTSDDRNLDVPEARRDVNQIPLGTKEELSTRQNKTMQADSILKSLSPLINSMRAFGLYFARVTPGTTSPLKCKCITKCQTWNAAQIYATIMLALTWLNAARYYVVIDFGTKKTLDADLFVKLGTVSHLMLNVILRSAYYIGSHTGSLDRVFRQAEVSTADFAANYNRRAKVVTIACWIAAVSNPTYAIYLVYFNGEFNDLSMVHFNDETFRMFKPYADIVRGIFVVLLELEAFASFVFTQAMKYITLKLIAALFSLKVVCRSVFE